MPHASRISPTIIGWTLASLHALLFVFTTVWCDDYNPRGLKILVEEDRMYQFDGGDILSALSTSHTATRMETRLGEELIPHRISSETGQWDKASLGSFKGYHDAKVRISESKVGLDSEDVGTHCLKVESKGDDVSLVGEVGEQFALEGGKRYRISCKVYSEEGMDRIALCVNSHHAGVIYSVNDDTNTVYGVNEPGRWTQISATLEMPDTGRHLSWIEVGHRKARELTWYVGDFSVREILKVPVTYSLRAKSSAEKAFTLAGLKADEVNLYNMGKTIPVDIEDLSPEQTITPDTTFTFWGDAPRGETMRRNKFTKENAYVLVFNDSAPPHRYLRAHENSSTEKHDSAITTRVKTVHMERDSILKYYQHFEGPPTDRVFWCEFRSPPRTKGNQIYLDFLRDLSKDSVPSRIRLLLWGNSKLSKDPDHDWTVELNRKPIGMAKWDGVHQFVFESSAIGEHFKADPRMGKNVLRMVNNHEDDAVDVVSLDWVEIEYEATLSAEDDFLEYTLDENRTDAPTRLANSFSGTPIRIFRRNSDVELVVRTERSGGSFGAQYQFPEKGGPYIYRAVGPKGFTRPGRLEVVHKSSLKAISAPPDYLIISHRNFIGALEPLIRHRRKQGLSVLAVDVGNVYNEYSHGVFSPEAIRLFVNDLLHKSSEDGPSLNYVFLVGDATYDYKGLKKGSPNFVPTHQVDNEGILPDNAPTFAQDDYFVFGAGDGIVPRAAVGRLPCNESSEVEAFVEKVLTYEDDDANRDPFTQAVKRRRALLIAAPDFASYNFLSGSDTFENWDIERIVGTDDADEDTSLQASLVDEFSKGCEAVYFIGHGGGYVWRMRPSATGKPALFTNSHVEQLSNVGRYPIIFTTTCFSALFDAPLVYHYKAESGLGAYFVQVPKKGAVALIGQGGKASVWQVDLFIKELMHNVFDGSFERLGDAYLVSKKNHVGPAFSGIALIGDPALKLRKSEN